jgi:hypothetical protein
VQRGGDPQEYRGCLVSFANQRAIALEYSAAIAPALGLSSRGKITLLPGQSAAGEFVTLAQELAHELMHQNERRDTTSQCVRKTEAEAVAYVVCQAVGLDTLSATKDYIQLYNGDAAVLIKSLEIILLTANTILASIASG